MDKPQANTGALSPELLAKVEEVIQVQLHQWFHEDFTLREEGVPEFMRRVHEGLIALSGIAVDLPKLMETTVATPWVCPLHGCTVLRSVCPVCYEDLFTSEPASG